MGGHSYTPLPTHSDSEPSPRSSDDSGSPAVHGETGRWSPAPLIDLWEGDDKSPRASERSSTYTPHRASQPRPQPTTITQRLIVCLLLITVWPILYLIHSSFLSPFFTLSSPSTLTTVPPLSPSFLAQCDSLLQSPPETFTNRLHSLVKALPPSTGWIAEPGPSAEYFLGGFGSSDWWLSERPFLIHVANSSSSSTPFPVNDVAQSAKDNDRLKKDLPTITLLTPAFEALRASLISLPDEIARRVKWVEWKEDQSPYSVLEHAVSTQGVVLDGMVRHFVGEGLRGVFREEKGEEVVQAVKTIRERKDEREVGLLRCANQLTLHATRKTRTRMYIGITESQTSAILHEEMAATGLTGGEGLVLFGENAALPHGSGTDRVLGKHDLALIDTGGKWGGYVADVTRTFALPDSEIPKIHIDIWETVRRAQHAPYDLLLSSNSTVSPIHAELDKTARRIVTASKAPSDFEAEAGPDFSVFTHRLGHGIGLEGHESPYLVQGPLGSKPVLSGHVFSLEPGVYLPSDGKEDWFGIKGVGVRLEDCFLVTEDNQGRLGGEWLSGPVEKWGDI
ncbi:hypothetical protein IAR55_003335 [Kwoniella newhampshirensis]|uniref:Peptidase M24 domain-containing protein n=1 Tax=Kwoniella newhampshirensis TaxID=1651941 RepID=A0AAW0YYW4_9TREE